MYNENKSNDYFDEPITMTENDSKLLKLQKELYQANITIFNQSEENKNLKKDVLLKEQLNSHLSNLHLSSNSKEKENQTNLNLKDIELQKAQQHITTLANIILKNKESIKKLKRSKIQNDILYLQIENLNKEKKQLWDTVNHLYNELIDPTNTSVLSKYDKAKHLLSYTAPSNMKKKKYN